MGIVWSIVITITILGVLFALSLGFSFLILAMTGHHSDRSARNSTALIVDASIAALLYAGLGVIITACWFPDLYLHYAKPYVWWFLGIFVVSLLVGRMMGGTIPQSSVVARVLPIFVFGALALVAFIMAWVAPFCIQ